MNNKNYTAAKVLILIPVIACLISAGILIPLTISYLSTGSDVTAVGILIAGSLCLVVTTLPCLIMSIVGTVLSAKAKKEGQTSYGKFFMIGIIEIVVCSLGVVCMIAAVAITIIAATR